MYYFHLLQLLFISLTVEEDGSTSIHQFSMAAILLLFTSVCSILI